MPACQQRGSVPAHPFVHQQSSLLSVFYCAADFYEWRKFWPAHNRHLQTHQYQSNVAVASQAMRHISKKVGSLFDAAVIHVLQPCTFQPQHPSLKCTTILHHETPAHGLFNKYDSAKIAGRTAAVVMQLSKTYWMADCFPAFEKRPSDGHPENSRSSTIIVVKKRPGYRSRILFNHLQKKHWNIKPASLRGFRGRPSAFARKLPPRRHLRCGGRSSVSAS